MSNVIAFPDTMQRAWGVFARDITQHFQAAGATPDLIAHLLTTMEPVYLQAAQPADFSGRPDEVVDALNDWVRGLVGNLLVLIAIREAELYQHGLR